MHPVCKQLLVLFAMVMALIVLEVFDAYRQFLDALEEAEDPLQELYLQFAEDLNAAGIRRILQEPNVDPNAKDDKGGALFRILNRPAESAEMLDSVRAVLEHKDANPNGVGNHWPPLKIAVVKGHRAVAQELLNHPRTKKEIHPAGLSCEAIAQLPNEVFLSFDPNAPQCVVDHPRFRRQKEAKKASGPSSTPGGTQAATANAASHKLDDANPFQLLPEGTLPRQDLYVMNPAAFDNILDALRYYVFGKPWSGFELSVIVVIVLIQLGMTIAVFHQSHHQ